MIIKAKAPTPEDAHNSPKNTVAVACDHGGLELKQSVAEHVRTKYGMNVLDFGTNDKSSCDYPDFARPAAQAVAEGRARLGIVICTTGIGVSMVANKVKGVRCALCLNPDMAHMTRAHNNANVLAMGQKYVTPYVANEIVDQFLDTPFEGGRHAVRVDKIEK